MISALTGELRQVEEDRVHLRVGPLLCELLIPASDVPLLQAGIGEEMTFHTVLYVEGDLFLCESDLISTFLAANPIGTQASSAHTTDLSGALLSLKGQLAVAAC